MKTLENCAQSEAEKLFQMMAHHSTLKLIEAVSAEVTLQNLPERN